MRRASRYLGMVFAIGSLVAFVLLWAGLSLAGTPQPDPPNKNMQIDKLSPQPEPPDKNLKLKQLGPQPEPPDSPLGKKQLGPQPEPPDKAIKKGIKTKSIK